MMVPSFGVPHNIKMTSNSNVGARTGYAASTIAVGRRTPKYGLLFLFVSSIIMSQLTQLTTASSSSASGTVATSPSSSVTSSETAASNAGGSGGGNPIFQLVGFVKDSVVRTVNGSREMYRNHGRCNEIRSKQRDYRDKLKEQWEMEEKGLSRKELQQRLKSINGGITYDEYIFLVKGKEDRGKLMNLVFLMFGATKFLPYALMFYPDMLPSPLASLPDSGNSRETKLEKLSRQRSHAVMTTLLQLERDAKLVPTLSKLNIFGRKAQQQQLDKMQEFNQCMAKIFATPGARDVVGAQVVLNALDDQLYTPPLLLTSSTADNTTTRGGDDSTGGGAGSAVAVASSPAGSFTRAEQRLVQVPKPIIQGLTQALEGPSMFQNIQPHFMGRGKIVAHCQKVAEADMFLVNENVNLEDLSSPRLKEACNDRLIGCPRSTDEELRNGLKDWLQVAVVEPTNRTKRTGQAFNANLARAALLSYYSLEGTRDERSASYLPRILFQGQCNNKQHSSTTEGSDNDGGGVGDGSDKKKFWGKR